MTMADVKDIQYHEHTTVVHVTKQQAIELMAAIDEKMKKVRDEFKGVELMTAPKHAGPKIRIGLWREEKAESSE